MSRIDDFRNKWPDAEFGPGHIVLSDGNIEDGHIDFCLAILDYLIDGKLSPDAPTKEWMEDLYREEGDPEEWKATREFLTEFKKLPEEERAKDYGWEE